MRSRERLQVALAYACFVLVGVNAGVGGVLLPAQIADYRVDRPTIGLTFFTFSAGFLLAGLVTGPLLHRLGSRWALVAGSVTFLTASLYTAARPPFVGLVAVQVISGFGMGVVESLMNSHLTTLPGSAVLLGRLHAFFGIGALIGPVFAAWTLQSHPWTTVVLLAAIGFVPVVGVFVTVLPGDRRPAAAGEVAAGPDGSRGLLGTVARQPAVVLAAVFLTVYVGLEISIGNWGYSYLVGERRLSGLAAGNAVSGFWLGLTLGRFVIEPVTERLGWTLARTTTSCLAGVAVVSLAIWAAPVGAVAIAGVAVLGFFLGPLFPTTMAVMPLLAEPRFVPAAIGLLNGISVIGGSGLPWLAGALTQGVGLWTLLPYVAFLAALQLVIWRRLVPRFRTATQLADHRPPLPSGTMDECM